jgi:hypothetical protein
MSACEASTVWHARTEGPLSGQCGPQSPIDQVANRDPEAPVHSGPEHHANSQIVPAFPARARRS